MKNSLFSNILATICCASYGLAEDKQALTSPEVATAHVLGNLPDGTPPPPEKLRPKFIVPVEEIIASRVHQQGGRQITVQKITPIALHLPPEAVPIDINDPALKQHIAQYRATHPALKMLLVGATVYHSKDSPPRTLVRLWHQAEGTPVSVWSSADFSLLSGVSTFADSSGNTASLMMMWSVTNLDHANALQRKFARQFTPPEIPTLPEGKATYVVTGGTPNTETLASIQSLHDLYNNEHTRLLAAFQGRERARLATGAELKAHPPKPKDIVLNHWDIGENVSTTQAPPKGDAR